MASLILHISVLNNGNMRASADAGRSKFDI